MPTANPIGLRQWIWRAFVRSALIPLVLVETALIAIYLLTNNAIRDEQIEYLRDTALNDLQAAVSLESRLVSEQLSQIGALTLTGESSVGSGVRRLEAYVGMNALGYLATERALVAELSSIVKAPAPELPEKVGEMIARLRDAERELEKLRREQVAASAGSLTDQATDVSGVTFVGQHVAGGAGGDVRQMVLDTRGRLGEERPVVVALTGDGGGKPVIVVATNESARARGVKAGSLVRVAAQTLGGGGGGKDDLAQGGGSDAGQVQAALSAVERELASTVTGATGSGS